MQSYDVIIIGLGGMGSAAAYQLARRGKRVLGLERFTAAHSQGSSHGKSRIIRQAYFEHPDYVPLLMRAYQLWEQIEHDSQTQLLTLTGGLMIGRAGNRTLEGSIRSANEYHLPHELLDAAEIRRRFPPFQVSDDFQGLYENKAGFLHPEQSVAAHLQLATALGAELHFEEPALDWQADPDHIKVHTASGRYSAERLILAPGAWAPRLMADLRVNLTVERNILFWFEPVTNPEAFLPERFPIYIWETEPGVQIYGFPTQAGPPGGVKVALFHSGTVCTPETIDRQVHSHEVEHMRAMLAAHIPSLNGPLLETATCMYTSTADEHFIVALHPQHTNVVVASPCSGHGYKFASVMGEILAELATEGHTRHPIGLFDPQRLAKTEAL